MQTDITTAANMKSGINYFICCDKNSVRKICNKYMFLAEFFLN